MASVLVHELPAEDVQPAVPTQTTSNVAYFLPSNNDERVRLAIQHNLILKGVGNKLVHAPVTLDEGSSVLESGTGSGIWLQDLTKVVPATTELIGMDIEANLFPQPSTLPPNLQFQVQSVLNLPKEWTNKFDLVHQRLLIFGLRDAEWRKALGEIYRVLKPGGWFQLFEIDEWEESGPKLTVAKQILSRLVALRDMGFWPNGSVKWQRYVKEAGFADIRVTWHYTPIGKWAGQDGSYGKENKLGLMRGSKKALINFGLMDEKEFNELYEQVDEEMNSHPGTRARFIMICAQKPAQIINKDGGL